MAKTVPTAESHGPNAYLYVESVGELRAQINGVYALSIIFLILCSATMTLRVYVRALMLKNFGLDDWLLVLTLVSYSGCYVHIK